MNKQHLKTIAIIGTVVLGCVAMGLGVLSGAILPNTGIPFMILGFVFGVFTFIGVPFYIVVGICYLVLRAKQRRRYQPIKDRFSRFDRAIPTNGTGQTLNQDRSSVQNTRYLCFCPYCDQRIDTADPPSYCYLCGQKI